MTGDDSREREPRGAVDELLDEESIAVLAILLAVSLEFGFGFAKTVAWWAGLIAGPAALLTLVVLFRLQRTRVWLVRLAAWVVRPHAPGGRRRGRAGLRGSPPPPS